MNTPLYMFVWDADFLTNYTSGIAVAVASDVTAARKAVIRRYIEDMKWSAHDLEAWQRDRLRSVMLDLRMHKPKVRTLPNAAIMHGGS